MHRLRAFVGLLAITATLISVFYITSKGSENSKKSADSALVQNLKNSNKTQSLEVQRLEEEIKKLKEEQLLLHQRIEQDKKHLESLTMSKLTEDYLKCLESGTNPPSEILKPEDIKKYTNNLINKSPEVKKFMQEKVDSNIGRFLEITTGDTANIINFYAVEILAENIYPECQVSRSIRGTYQYDIKKATVKKV